MTHRLTVLQTFPDQSEIANTKVAKSSAALRTVQMTSVRSNLAASGFTADLVSAKICVTLVELPSDCKDPLIEILY